MKPANLVNSEAVTDRQQVDLIVAGGGLAGICASIAAARLGHTVILVQDRPVLGGNSSSEIRVAPHGASFDGYFRDARETGLIEEFLLEARSRGYALKQQNGSPYPIWDMILLEKVLAEPNITLLLNTLVVDVILSEDNRRIKAVRAIQLASEKTFELQAAMFVDATGDGTLGWRSGASFRMGREAKNEFGESRAVEKADEVVLGSTMMFSARDAGRPVPFRPPSWAYHFPTCADLPFREHSKIDSGYWWIEWGSNMNTIKDNDRIRQDLTAFTLGVWDHIKNHCDHKAQATNFVLDWFGQVVGKRESRRFIGDYILKQADLEDPVLFEDRVAYGGWPIDLHPDAGILSREHPCDQPVLPGLYSIPFRSIYSKDIENLFFAGRNISVTHVAFGSTRVQKTCSIIGQAAGTAAALCLEENHTPHELASQIECMRVLQQKLLQQDGYLLDLPLEDENDLATRPSAKIQASSEAQLETTSGEPAKWLPLDRCRAQSLYFAHPEQPLQKVALQLKAAQATSLKVRIGSIAHLRDFGGRSQHPSRSIEQTIELAAGWEGWVEIELPPSDQLKAGPVVVQLDPAEGVNWALRDLEPDGTQAAEWSDELGYWFMLHGTHGIQTSPVSQAYSAQNVTNGVTRPEVGANLWISDPAQPLPQWLELDLGSEQLFNEVSLTFDSGLSLWVVEGIFPTLVRDYAVQIKTSAGEWRSIVAIEGNYQRLCQHRFEPVKARYIRLLVIATNGVPSARVFALRVYHNSATVL